MEVADRAVDVLDEVARVVLDARRAAEAPQDDVAGTAVGGDTPAEVYQIDAAGLVIDPRDAVEARGADMA